MSARETIEEIRDELETLADRNDLETSDAAQALLDRLDEEGGQ